MGALWVGHRAFFFYYLYERSLCMLDVTLLNTDEIKLVYCYNYYKVHNKLPNPDNYSREKTLELNEILTRQIERRKV